MRGHPDWSLEVLPLWLYKESMKKKYWSNVCAMLGVALIATAAFQHAIPAVGLGIIAGCLFLLVGDAIAGE